MNGNAIPVGNLTTVAPAYVNEHDFSVNSDVTLGRHQFSTRYLYDRIREPDFNASLPAPQFLGTKASGNHKAILSDVWTISSHIINNARASYSRTIGPQLVAPTAFADFPNVIVDDLSSVNVGPEQNAPQSYIQNVYQLSDTFNYIRGSHSLKFGVEGKKYIAPTDGLPRARGEWDYTTLSQLVNDFVPNGAPNKALRGAGSGSVPENYPAIYWFVQDDWKLTSRLTLNLGLRYEYVGVPVGDKRQAMNSISDDPALGPVLPGTQSGHQQLRPPRRLCLRPNWAWQVGDSRRSWLCLRRDPQQFRDQQLATATADRAETRGHLCSARRARMVQHLGSTASGFRAGVSGWRRPSCSKRSAGDPS